MPIASGAPPQVVVKESPGGILNYFETQYVKIIKRPILFDGTDTEKAQALVRTYGLKELEPAVDRYFAEGDQYTRERGFPFWLFAKQILKSQAKAG